MHAASSGSGHHGSVPVPSIVLGRLPDGTCSPGARVLLLAGSTDIWLLFASNRCPVALTMCVGVPYGLVDTCVRPALSTRLRPKSHTCGHGASPDFSRQVRKRKCST